MLPLSRETLQDLFGFAQPWKFFFCPPSAAGSELPGVLAWRGSDMVRPPAASRRRPRVFPQSKSAVMFGVLLGGVFVVLDGMQVMAMSDLGVMRSLFVIAGFVVLGRLAMMLGRVVVVERRLLVMLVNLVRLVAIHRSLPG
jgi:hypothetical protein